MFLGMQMDYVLLRFGIIVRSFEIKDSKEYRIRFQLLLLPNTLPEICHHLH